MAYVIDGNSFEFVDGIPNTVANYTYTGVDLTAEFADEIANYSDEWAWLKARITTGDFSGINIGDYIEVTTGYTISESMPFVFKAQVAGINTYKGYNGTVKNHIDFISERLFPQSHRYNEVNTNNGNNYDGSASNPTHIYPWLASDLYLWLNSLSGSIQGSLTEEIWSEENYTQSGVYFYLPDILKSVITPKVMNLPIRYNASSQLSDDNNFGMVNVGNLWLPDEIEVYGMPVQGGKTYATTSNAVQYPIFAGNMRRIKYAGNSGGNAQTWWLSTASARDSQRWCYVSSNGPASGNTAIRTYYVPICFRVMA